MMYYSLKLLQKDVLFNLGCIDFRNYNSKKFNKVAQCNTEFLFEIDLSQLLKGMGY